MNGRKLSGSGVELKENDIVDLFSDVGDILLTMLEDEEGLEG